MMDEDQRQFLRLLLAFCEHDLDMFENWRIPTSYGEAYVSISVQPRMGTTPEDYDLLDVEEARG